jgi:hypothetical protein
MDGRFEIARTSGRKFDCAHARRMPCQSRRADSMVRASDFPGCPEPGLPRGSTKTVGRAFSRSRAGSGSTARCHRGEHRGREGTVDDPVRSRFPGQGFSSGTLSTPENYLPIPARRQEICSGERLNWVWVIGNGCAHSIRSTSGSSKSDVRTFRIHTDWLDRDAHLKSGRCKAWAGATRDNADGERGISGQADVSVYESRAPFN